jgi:hypothetical protein
MYIIKKTDIVLENLGDFLERLFSLFGMLVGYVLHHLGLMFVGVDSCVGAVTALGQRQLQMAEKLTSIFTLCQSLLSFFVQFWSQNLKKMNFATIFCI